MVDFGNTQFEGGITPAVVQQAPVVDRSGEVLASGLAGAARTVGAIAGNVFQANQENLGQAALNDFRFNAINIANAVDQGNISVPEARSRLRALYSESLSANPNLGGDLDKLYSSIVGTSSGIGHIALEGNESYQRTQSMIDAAVNAGYINNPNDPEQVARGVGAMQQLASSTNTLALLQANNSISDIQRETGIKSEMRTFAQAGSVWVQNRIQQAEQELEAGADPAEVVASLRADYAANTSYIQGVAQEYESDWVLAPMNTLIENFEARATGAIEAEVYTQMNTTEQAKFEVMMRADEELGTLIAATKILGNDFPGLANMMVGPANEKLKGILSGRGADLFDETESTEVNLDLAISRAAEINTMTGDPVAQQEGETLLRSIFRSGATAVDVSGPAETRKFIETLADPEMNTLAVNNGGQVPTQYVEGTRNLVQQYYQNPLLEAVQQRWEDVEIAIPPAGGIVPGGMVTANTTDFGVQYGRPEDFIDVVWNGDGIQFVAKPDYANDIGVKSIVQGLNTGNDSVAQPLNTLIRAIGTIENTNDFKSIWERDFANRLFGQQDEFIEDTRDVVNELQGYAPMNEGVNLELFNEEQEPIVDIESVPALQAISDAAPLDPNSFLEPTNNPAVDPAILSRYAGSRLPVSIRNNNMGAVSITGDIESSWAARQPGFVGTSPRPANEGGYYAKYATPEHGVGAASKLLENYGRQGVNTPLAIVTKWSADRSAHQTYANTLTRYLNEAGFTVDTNTPLDLSDPMVRFAVLKAKSAHEAGTGRPVYNDEVFLRGVSYQFGA